MSDAEKSKPPIYWPTILDAIEAGLAGDIVKCRAYTQLLLEKLQENGETRIASHVLNILAGEKGQSMYPSVSEVTKGENDGGRDYRKAQAKAGLQ